MERQSHGSNYIFIEPRRAKLKRTGSSAWFSLSGTNALGIMKREEKGEEIIQMLRFDNIRQKELIEMEYGFPRFPSFVTE